MKRMILTSLVALFAVFANAERMMTTWGEKVTPENAWRSYPRPQMVRDNWVNLNGAV